MIEDIYSHRQTAKKETTTLHESVCEWLSSKFKVKQMMD